MPSPALGSLKRAIDQLVAERDAVKDRLDRIDKSLDSLKKSYNLLVGLEHHQLVDTVKKAPEPHPFQQIKHRIMLGKNPDKRDVAASVAAMLMDTDKPMSRREIFDSLAMKGIVISGKDPEMVLSTMLWRAGEEFGIENKKGIGYILKSKDYGILG